MRKPPRRTLTSNADSSSIGSQVKPDKGSVDPWGLLREHVALVLTASVFALSVLRVFFVSFGNPTTVLALIGEANPVTVVALTAFSVVPFVYGALLGFGARDVRNPNYDRLGRGLVAFGVAAVLGFFIASPGFLLVLPLAVLGGFVGRKRAADRGGERPGNEYAIWALVGIVIAMMLTDFTDPWLPPETIETDDGSVIVGYVVTERGDDELLVLRDDNRVVVPLARSEIESREFCTHANGLFFGPPFAWSHRSDSYPECPNED